jgi:hypothetical protein
MSQTIRETASNRRVSQDALLTNLTVSDNCILPCLDDRIKSIVSSQVQNVTANPMLVAEVTVTRNALFDTAPRRVTLAPTFDYPAGVTTTLQGQPNVNEGLITIIPAPGAKKLIVPQLIEIVAPADPAASASYEAVITGGPPVTPPNLVFQLWNRYPTKTNNQTEINNLNVIGPSFEDNTTPGGGGGNSIVVYSKVLQASRICMDPGGSGIDDLGIALIVDTLAANECELSTRTSVDLNVKSTACNYAAIPTALGFDFSPVNQPLTLFADQPLVANEGRNFTIKVHYNVIPTL